MRKFIALTVWLATLLMLLLASGVYAQEDAGVPFAAIQDGKLTLFGLGDTPLAINNPPNKGFFSLAWSPDGTKLAYIMNDEQFLARLLLVDVTTGSDPVTLNTGTLESGFPVTFTPDGNIIYMGQGTFPTDVSQPYHSDVKRIAADASAQPETVGSFTMMVGCGGGSPFPADWQYWGETGFGGDALTLTLTDFGLLHSTSCAGNGLALFDLTTGEDKPVGPVVMAQEGSPTPVGIGRAALSPDGKLLVAVKSTFTANSITRSLATLDLASNTLTDLKTDSEPDQVAWSQDGSTLFYSSRTVNGNLTDTLGQADKDKLGAIVGYGVDGKSVDVPAYTVTIHQLNPATGEDTTLYTADAYSVGRMAAAPDGGALLFSQIANMNSWVTALTSGTFDPQNDADGSQARALVPVSLYRLPLTAGAQPVQVGQNLSQFTFQASRQ